MATKAEKDAVLDAFAGALADGETLAEAVSAAMYAVTGSASQPIPRRPKSTKLTKSKKS